MSQPQAADDSFCGLFLRGIVQGVFSFTYKDKEDNDKEITRYRIIVSSVGTIPYEVVSKSNGLERGQIYHGTVSLPKQKEYKDRKSLGCYEIKRLSHGQAPVA